MLEVQTGIERYCPLLSKEKFSQSPIISELEFPFRNKTVYLTSESEHFKAIDIYSQVAIPLAPHPGAFGVSRKFHIHEGVDLYCHEQEPVYAMQSGVVLAILKFTGPHAGTPWWHDTYAVAIEGSAGVINYGELMPNQALKVGDYISKGELIGTIMTVLRKDKGRPRNMLHLELYEKGAQLAQGWELGTSKPKGLLDPTNLLIKAAGLHIKSGEPL